MENKTIIHYVRRVNLGNYESVEVGLVQDFPTGIATYGELQTLLRDQVERWISENVVKPRTQPQPASTSVQRKPAAAASESSAAGKSGTA